MQRRQLLKSFLFAPLAALGIKEVAASQPEQPVSTGYREAFVVTGQRFELPPMTVGKYGEIIQFEILAVTSAYAPCIVKSTHTPVGQPLYARTDINLDFLDQVDDPQAFVDQQIQQARRAYEDTLDRAVLEAAGYPARATDLNAWLQERGFTLVGESHV